MKTLLKFILKSPLALMLRMNRTLTEFYLAGYISTGISSGIYDVMAKGPAGIDEIRRRLGENIDRLCLEAWLDMGVSLGELQKKDDRCTIKNSFSKKLLLPANDTWRSFFQARVEIFYDYVIHTPAYLKDKKKSVHSTDEPLVRHDRGMRPSAAS